LHWDITLSIDNFCPLPLAPGGAVLPRRPNVRLCLSPRSPPGQPVSGLKAHHVTAGVERRDTSGTSPSKSSTPPGCQPIVKPPIHLPACVCLIIA
jgi:hypothetical protein